MPTYVVTGPDGQKYRVSAPEGATDADVMARVRGVSQPKEKPTSFWQGVGEGVNNATSNALAYLEEMPIVGVPAKIAGTIGDLVGLKTGKVNTARPHSMASQAKGVLKDVTDRSKYRGSTAGKITGEIAASLPLLAAGGAITQGVAGGALTTADPYNKRGVARDAAIGAAGGYIGDKVGKYVVAPVAERIGRTKAAQTVGDLISTGVGKVTGKTLPMPPRANFTPTDKAVNRMDPVLEDVRAKLAQAAEMDLPYSLADSSPELRMLAGSVARKSPQARALAEETFIPRARGQADRAVNAIDNYLAPVTNIEQRAGEIRTAAQTASEPFYTAARAKAAPVDEELAMMLETPAGKQALREAYTTAANSGRNPQGIGFNLDDQGEVVLQEAPSFETLQLVKRAMDSQLEPARNPITGSINLEGRPDLQAIAGLRERLNSKLGTLNDDYAKGNETYAGIIRRRDALNLGQDVSKGGVPQRQFDAALGRMDETTLPEMQRGYATSMADTANRQRLSGNPYDAVYGSTDQQAKVGALFPEGAPQFDQLYNFEGDMAKTAQETLGGSPTQARAMADQLFDENGAASTAMNLVTNPHMGVIGLVQQTLGDHLRTRGANRASDIAPALFDTDPRVGQAYLDTLLKTRSEAEARKAAYKAAGSVLGLPSAVVGSSVVAP